MSFTIGLVGLDSSHAEDFIRHINAERRHPGLRVISVAGGDESRVAELRRVDPGLTACAPLDRLIDGVDAVIVGHRDGGLHRAAAIACLEAGRPVFVDKPLANSRADAEAIVAAGEASGTPLLSGSTLRWQAETRRIKARLAGIEGNIELHAWGTWYPDSEYGGAIFYAIHTIELALELLGPDFRKVKLGSGDDPAVSYRSDSNDVTLSFHPPGSSGHSEFGAVITAKGVHFGGPVLLGDDYMAPAVDQFATMLRTGKSPMSREELIAPMALMEAIEAVMAVSA